MAWPGERQRHAVSARGISTKRPQVVESKVVWFTSRGVFSEMVSLLDMMGLDKLFEDKKSAKGYPDDVYTADARMIALLPAERAADSVDWLTYEWDTTKSPQRRLQLLKLAQNARFKITQELQLPTPAHTQNHLRQSRRYYNDFIINVGGS